MVDSYLHMSAKTESNNPIVESMFKVGAHYGFIKSRRHPTIKSFIFGVKNKIEIFDLEKTEKQLESALDFVKSIGASGKQLVFVGSKSESKNAIKEAADRIAQPYVAGRWIGGTFTNFEAIKKRIEKLLDLTDQKEKGDLNKYTKKERVMIDREIERLNNLFGGMTSVSSLPGAIFVVDSRKEHIAVAEANQKNIPVIALTGSDCDISIVDFPVVANDSSVDSIKFFTDKIAEAYEAGKKAKKALATDTTEVKAEVKS
jgi:small subunit ribosomal protein S2